MSNIQETIKPCPFCGRKRQKVELLGSFGPVNEAAEIELWVIQCKCGAEMIQADGNKTIEAWNTRPK